jgi:hypothetical protein
MLEGLEASSLYFVERIEIFQLEGDVMAGL